MNIDKPFTIGQIHDAAGKVKSGADFPQFVRELIGLGILRYDNEVADGRATYHGKDGFVIEGTPKYPAIAIGSISSQDKLKHALSVHQQGQTDYPAFCRQAAEAGVPKWTSDLKDMTVSYFDKHGNVLLVEPIPQP